MSQANLDEFNRLKLENPKSIWRCSVMKEISGNPILKSADRAGYYITVK